MPCILYPSSVPKDQITIVFGEHDRNVTHESPTHYRKIDTIIKHRSFNRANFYNDIAVLRMDKPIRFSRYISPACLPIDLGLFFKKSWKHYDPVRITVIDFVSFGCRGWGLWWTSRHCCRLGSYAREGKAITYLKGSGGPHHDQWCKFSHHYVNTPIFPKFSGQLTGIYCVLNSIIGMYKPRIFTLHQSGNHREHDVCWVRRGEIGRLSGNFLRL